MRVHSSIADWGSARAKQFQSFCQVYPWTLPILACIAVVLARLRSAPGVDVAVLITWAERMIDGARPFVDFIEVNPPGSVLLYVPAAAAARLTGLPTEICSELLQLGLIALSLALCWRILSPTDVLDKHDRHLLLALAIAIIGVMPAVTFGQREHVGIIAALPIIALPLAEATGHLPSRWLRLAAGILAGVSMIAKPHFALIFGAVGVFGMLMVRTFWLALRIQWLAAAATAALYVGLTWWAYPTFYTTHLPKIAEVYLGWRVGPVGLLNNPLLLIFAVGFIMLNRQFKSRLLTSQTWLIVLAAVVALSLFFLQARGWPYHALPALVLVCMALAWEASRKDVALTEAGGALDGAKASGEAGTDAVQPPPRREMLGALAIMIAIAFFWNDRDHNRDIDKIAATVTATHPNPRMLTIAEDISIGHPLVRQVKGTWTHQVTHLWTAFGVYLQLPNKKMPAEKRARLIAYLKGEIADLAASIEREKPDIIVAQRGWRKSKDVDWLEWAQKWPSLSKQLAEYDPVARIDDVEILKRRNAAAAAPASALHAARQTPALSRVP